MFISIYLLPLLLTFLCTLNESYSRSTSLQSKCSTAYDFEYLLLVSQWPEAFCETEKCVDYEDVWSIHGSWPQYLNGKWPEDCCFDMEFKSEQIDSIKSELNIKWKDLKSGDTVYEFWSHEWVKHGTCTMNAPLLKGQFNYFKNTLAAFSKLSLDKWLKEANITPSLTQTYSVSAFHSAITKGLGYRVRLECLKKKYNSSPIMTQIYVCLNKDTLKPFDCPTNLVDENCGTDTIAYLPTKK